MTVTNVLFLIWAAAMLATAQFFWRRGQTFAPMLMLIGSILIVLGQLMAIYAKANPHGG